RECAFRCGRQYWSARCSGARRHRQRVQIVIEPEPRRPLLLVADDEPVNLKLLVDGLRDDFRIRIATDGESALAIASDDEPPDLILLDVMMPRIETSLAFLMADIDYFKQYNDLHGHLAGDDCLKRVAIAFAGAMRRPTDLTARYGGEEFVALLGDTDAEGASRVADAMRRKVEQ